MTHDPRISFKRGDSFSLDITITDPNSVDALALYDLLVIAQEAYQAALDADPQVPQDIADALQAMEDAQDAYDLEIIVDITGWTITSSLRWCGKLISDFVVTIIDPAIGTLTVTATAAITALWKEREHKMDILFVRDGITTSSETIMIDVERGATHG